MMVVKMAMKDLVESVPQENQERCVDSHDPLFSQIILKDLEAMPLTPKALCCPLIAKVIFSSITIETFCLILSFMLDIT